MLARKIKDINVKMNNIPNDRMFVNRVCKCIEGQFYSNISAKLKDLDNLLDLFHFSTTA